MSGLRFQIPPPPPPKCTVDKVISCGIMWLDSAHISRGILRAQNFSMMKGLGHLISAFSHKFNINVKLELVNQPLMDREDYSDGVTLRNFSERDVEDFLAWAGDSEVAKYTTWHPFLSRDKAQEFLRTVAIPHPWFKAICFHGKPVGHIKLEQSTDINGLRYARIAYAVGRQYWSKGIATEAVREAVRIGRKELQLERVEALVLPENIASLKVLEKTGFKGMPSYFENFNVKGNIHAFFSLVLITHNASSHIIVGD
eukprot:Gb_37132 [translate_table: standard]